MRRSYKFQIKPTARQQIALTDMLADHCRLYNAALEERRTAYKTHGVTVRYGDQSAQLKEIRAFDSEVDPSGGQARWSFSSQQATLRRLNRAFDAFFRRVKWGERPGYPRFRSVHRFDTVEFPKNGDGCRWESTEKGRTSTWTHVYLQGVGHVKVNQHRAVQGRVKTLSVKREGPLHRPRWYLILSCNDVPAEPLPETEENVGIDLATGDNGLAYLSTGERIDNPQPRKRLAAKLAKAQREMDRYKPNPGRRASRRYREAAARARNISAKMARIRRDHQHKVALDLVRRFDVIAVEDIAPAQMTRRAKPKSNLDKAGNCLPNGQTAKSGLNRSILDAAWSQFLEILDAKAECAGRQVIRVNPAYTSQTCSACGAVDSKSRTLKVYCCTSCGHSEDADVNAAKNILGAGLALLGNAS